LAPRASGTDDPRVPADAPRLFTSRPSPARHFCHAAIALAVLGAGCSLGERSSASGGERAHPSRIEAGASATPSAATAAIAPRPSVQASASAAPASATPEGMSAIPAGFFLMGSPRLLGNPEERPMHERAVEAFYMDKTEVKLGAYHACVAAGKCAPARNDMPFCTEGEPGHDDHPVNCVSHVDATAYCAFAGKRLPTEAEWEYAASGGGEDRRFSWGNDDPTQANACFDRRGTCAVASFPAGAFGLFDMSGTVWEWTDSWFGFFPNEPDHGTEKVFKGGSFSRRWPKWLRARNRSHWPPERENAWLGFRCAKTKLPVECPANAAPDGERCKRVSGDPLCEPHMGWNGHACTNLDANGKPLPGDAPPVDTTGVPGGEDEPISVARTPGDDGDCEKNYFHKPAAYRWTGNTWDARIALVAARGCTRRDNAPTWVSACCPQ
jgi:formylglycine-generating enzyme required for sulfatase activity